MSNSFREKLGEIKRQPKREKPSTQAEKQRKAAPYVLKNILFDTEEKTVSEIIPEGVFSDAVSNHIGTVLGAGQGGKNGAGIWFTASRKVRRVQENAKIAFSMMTDQQIATFCEEHDLADGDAILELILALPQAEA